MYKLNVFQKTRIALLILIVIAFIIFIISFVKSKSTKNYTTEETLSDMPVQFEESDEFLDDDGFEILQDDGTWDDDILGEDDEEDEKDKENDTNKTEEQKKNNGLTYYLKINYSANVVTAYTQDSSGEYTVPARAMVCSTGTATPTSGKYKLSKKWRWHALFGGVYGQYCTKITGNILFHSVPYSATSPDSLKYAAYDKLGTRASAGCIRLTVSDAMWIYNNCDSGTYVEFYSSSDPGPLGKPSAQKVSWNEECKGWDPTDPDQRNPWRTYKGEMPNVSSNSVADNVETSSAIPENNIAPEKQPVQDSTHQPKPPTGNNDTEVKPVGGASNAGSNSNVNDINNSGTNTNTDNSLSNNNSANTNTDNNTGDNTNKEENNTNNSTKPSNGENQEEGTSKPSTEDSTQENSEDSSDMLDKQEEDA